jgi:hypothetical protein
VRVKDVEAAASVHHHLGEPGVPDERVDHQRVLARVEDAVLVIFAAEGDGVLRPVEEGGGAFSAARTSCRVPSLEVTKCDTNTSPRRLATHLLQQVDQSFTLRRHNGHGSANATRNNTSAIDQTTIAKASKALSEYHTMEALCGGPGYTGTVGCRAATYSTSSGTKSGSSSEK